MQATPLGKIVSTPGTPIQITTDTTINCQKLVVCQLAGQTGTVYFGKSNLKRSGDSPAFQGVIKQFQAPGTQFLDIFQLDVESGNDAIRASDYYVDADNATMGLLVTIVTE